MKTEKHTDIHSKGAPSQSTKQKRLGFVGIMVQKRLSVAEKLNAILSEHGNIVIGRMGVPRDDMECSIITLIVNATTDELGDLTGKLGQLPNVVAKSALTPPLHSDATHRAD